ncbi:DUF4129 domain-containing protein [Hahella aquimaris]|uniref:DUF4129 domain-containing protein n=1 Tax=Hahella sp. HNIBRBA332 TaxID=3015983 RepID=UPI00273CCB34|nr:DUF4129 domain-containing protein [Hahella sp. HNIBRBA332]WLQ12820.1 DUF4129 domain-containing protein [Hahella sp. HNIBRBA332]
MNPANINFRLRPRDHYEAVDLGCQFVRRWWKQLYVVWLLTMTPVVALCWLLIDDINYVSIAVWWVKPLFERGQLYFLSRAVFGAPPTIKETLRQTPKLMFLQCFATLTWRRFSPTRSFDLPVIQLEGLKGKNRQQRMTVLHRDNAASVSFWVTIVGVHLENFLMLAAVGLVVMFIPQGVQLEWETLFEAAPLYTACYFVGMALVGPIYAASGFALYLNRRITLEGWDLELIFRQLGQRLEERQGAFPSGEGGAARRVTQALCLVLALGALALPPSGSVRAETATEQAETADSQSWDTERSALTPDKAKEDIEKILKGSDFRNIVKKEAPKFWKEWEDRQEEKRDKQLDDFKSADFSFGEYFAQIFKLLIWATLIGLILYLLYRYRDSILALSWMPRIERKEKSKPTHVFDLDIREESLPPQLADEAWTLWEQGRHRDALGLLYRGGLSRLVHRHGLRLNRGATEGDCVAMVKRRQGGALSDYFAVLTRVWQHLAYAHELPTAERFQELCRGWSDVFDVEREGGDHAAQ